MLNSTTNWGTAPCEWTEPYSLLSHRFRLWKQRQMKENVQFGKKETPNKAMIHSSFLHPRWSTRLPTAHRIANNPAMQVLHHRWAALSLWEADGVAGLQVTVLLCKAETHGQTCEPCVEPKIDEHMACIGGHWEHSRWTTVGVNNKWVKLALALNS